MPPENGDHCDIGILAASGSEGRCTACGIAMAAGAGFGRKESFAARGVAAVFKHSPGPDVTGDLSHLAGLEMQLGGGHFAAVIPHFGSDVGHCLAGQARRKKCVGGLMTLGATFGVEQCFAVFARSGLEYAGALWRRRRQITQIDEKIGYVLPG